MRTVCLMFSTLLLWSCGGDKCREIPSGTLEKYDLKVDRLEEQFFRAENRHQVTQLLKNNWGVANQFFHAQEYPSYQILAGRIFNLLQQPSIDTLYQESVRAFSDFDAIKADLDQAFSWLNYYYPQTKTPKLSTMVSGLYNDLYISDSLIVIGLDYFIGPEATYKPEGTPLYILKRYAPEYLAPAIMKFLVGKYCRVGQENTLLSEMIDYGKIYYLLSKIMPCTPDHLLIGFTAEEMIDVVNNQEIIWANFVQNEILYETSDFTKKKFLGERPYVYEIGEKCPGRIGIWLGWQIVEAYMRTQNVKMQQLLADQDHHRIFSQSGYKPAKR
ncbi:MAG: gliding motility lipoprotein GldB [Cyclobacteriaceae bacterium]|nr:gliding motility lipoprotein GldB [Cyclobacteriaceae bacterium HetDA_MAG_MS6]